MNDNSVEGFEMYRRQRERRRLLGSGGERRPLSGPTNALRELEAVEEREHRDMQLRMEVHDFFESATRTAAEIVQKVAASARLQIDEKLGSEMQEFLLESLTRMQDLVQSVLSSNAGSTAEQVVEPLMHNLAGQVLDGFRRMGIKANAQQHEGQDPMEIDLDDVRREFQELIAAAPETTPAVEEVSTDHELSDALTVESQQSIEDHLVAEMHRQESAPEPVEETDPEADRITVEAPSQMTDAPPPAEPAPQQPDLRDLKRLKTTLETLVKTGQMTKTEARAAWEARKAALKV